MKLIDFPQLSPNIIALKLSDSVTPTIQWRRFGEVQLFQSDQIVLMKQDDNLSEVLARNSEVQLNTLLQRKDTLWVLVSEKVGLLQLQYAQPSESLHLDEKLEIQIEDSIVEQLYQAKQITKASVELAVVWCRNEFMLEGKPTRIAVTRHLSSSTSNMQLLGRHWRVDIKVGDDGKTRIVTLTRRVQSIDAWNIFSGNVDFVDFTVAAQILSPSQQALMNQSIQSNGSYLDLWRKYSEKEWEQSLQSAANLGALQYSKCTPLSDEGGGWIFHCDKHELQQFERKWRNLESDQSLALEAGETMPVWSDDRYTDLARADNSKKFRGRARFERGTVVIEVTNVSPPESGALYLSLTGDRTVQERRKGARENIESGRRLPQLHRILQQVQVPVQRSAVQHPALTPYAKDCFKSGEATERQESAIKLALNTTDIAIIIGPPGTGKTQVIAALERRLSEIGGGGSHQHQVLISSFQHDAVENALNRTSIYGLPALKVGGKKSKDGTDPFEVWRLQQLDQATKMYTEHAEKDPSVSILQSFGQKMAILRHALLDEHERRQTLNLANDLLTQLEDSQSVRISSSLMGKWREYIAALPATNQIQDSKIRKFELRKVRSLRVTSCGFNDDGPDRAYDVWSCLKNSSASVATVDLDKLMEFADATLLPTELEAEAVALRDRLIDKLMPDYRPPMIRHRLNSDGLQLLGQLEDVIGEKLKQSRLGVAGVLSRYCDSFVNHPERARMTVREYAMIVGATCQQAAGKDMANLKELSGIGDAGIAFDTVIIDEAARANPLDLFIPMSMANKRIILVGDHRQLPHLLEPLVEDEVSKQYNLSSAQKDAYKESLFERLWRQLKDQGRVVMLNTQFRMHPIMGAFVSRYFYEDAGLDKLEHGRGAEEFLSKVPGFEGKVCAWLDLPLHFGKEDRRGNSRVRIAEALKVAEEVKRILDVCDTNISIGVITFYSAQRDAIYDALSSHAVTERNDDTGEWQISSQYRETPNREERLRIGTVDAFQGKEFDIVFLSIVRSNEKILPNEITDPEIFEKAANSKYGHLRLNNRLNVAMSRQRSLLIAIGDSAMFGGEQEAKTAPVLAAFYQLCNGEHGLVR